MKQRRLGRTGLKVSVLGFGGGPFRGMPYSDRELQKLGHRAVELGFNLFETAEDYDESRMGLILKGLRRKVALASKSTADTEAAMRAAIDRSLISLDTDCIDVYQMHSVNSGQELAGRVEKGALRALQDARKEGKIRFVGISGHNAAALQVAIKTGDFDVIQVPYNMGHPITGKVIEKAFEADVGVLVMKPLAGGMLVDPAPPEDVRPKGAEAMTAERALGFVLANPHVSSALVGHRSVEEMERNARTAEKVKPPSAQELKRWSEEAESFLGTDFCRTCKYCGPCEVHGWWLDIDAILRAYGYYKIYGYRFSSARAYASMEIKADACIQCGSCEKRCPYNLPIRAMLREAHEIFSAAAFKFVRNFDKIPQVKMPQVMMMVGELAAEEKKLIEVARKKAINIDRYRAFEKSELKDLLKERDEVVRMELYPKVVGFADRGDAALAKGDRAAALREFKTGADFARENAVSRPIRNHLIYFLYRVAELQKEAGRGREAQKAEAELKERVPIEAHEMRELGEAMMARKVFGQAGDWLRRALELRRSGPDVKPEDMEPFINAVVRWHREQLRYDEAIEFLKEEVRQAPDQPGLLHNLGECYMEKADYAQAIRALRASIELRETASWVHFSLGKCLYKAGKFDAALREFESELELAGDELSHFHAWYFKAMCHWKRGERKAAEGAIENASAYRKFHGQAEIPEEKEFLAAFAGKDA